MCVMCDEIRSLTLDDQGVAEGHVVVLGHQLSDLMAHPCVGNQLSPFIRVVFTPCGHVYLCGKCQVYMASQW